MCDPEERNFTLRSSPREWNKKKNSNGNLVAPPTAAKDYGKLGHFFVSAPIIFFSVSLSSSSPSLSHLFFSLHLNYFSLSPLLPSSASSPILIARLAEDAGRTEQIWFSQQLGPSRHLPLSNISHLLKP